MKRYYVIGRWEDGDYTNLFLCESITEAIGIVEVEAQAYAEEWAWEIAGNQLLYGDYRIDALGLVDKVSKDCPF